MGRNRRGSRPPKGQGPRPEQRQDSSPTRLKVVAGGQTGVDRGALDAALELNLQCGGWCPEGRLAEDGAIPERYPVQELLGADYRERTRKNVLDSDGTAIIFFGELEGGSEHTLDDCVQLGKPYQLIDGTELQPAQAAQLIADFVRDRGVQTLNVAGPRASKVERGYKYAFDTVHMLMDALKRKGSSGRRPDGRPGRPPQQGSGQQGRPGSNAGAPGGGRGRNPQVNAQKRKGLGQHYRAKHGVK